MVRNNGFYVVHAAIARFESVPVENFILFYFIISIVFPSKSVVKRHSKVLVLA